MDEFKNGDTVSKSEVGSLKSRFIGAELRKLQHFKLLPCHRALV